MMVGCGSPTCIPTGQVGASGERGVRTQDIEIVLAIREHGSFSRAAESLSLSQPAVSLAVKRVEEELDTRIFDRSGQAITLTRDGERVIRGFDRILEIIAGIKVRRADDATLRIGLSPLLSGRDVARLLGGYFRSRAVGFAIEFLDSEEIAQRSDFDVRVVVPGLRRRSPVQVEFATHFIGAANGVFIRSRQEAQVWDRAMHVLVDHGVPVSQVIEVNDCGYAYHLAYSGAGFTPCVMTRENAFQTSVIPTLPALPPIRLDIFADGEVAELLRQSLSVHEGGGGVLPGRAAASPS
jgi:DNA-binding transcriptional LysR family regulator